MTDTWGIPGPAFAGLYLGLLLLPALSPSRTAGSCCAAARPARRSGPKSWRC